MIPCERHAVSHKGSSQTICVELEIRHTPTVVLCRIYGNLADIYKMFNIVYRRADFDLQHFNSETVLDEKGLKIIREILNRRHTSVLEFIYTQWYVECSRVASHEIVRHRIASYWQESQRYCIPRGMIIPRSLAKQEVVTALRSVYELYTKLIEGC